MKGTPDNARSPGTLFVVATPIGNLEDITLRALRVLRESALVAAEDTRRTGNLLRHYQIQTPLLSLHEHNEQLRAVRLVERLKAGDSVALVSDAGTPGISDPGAALVACGAGFRLQSRTDTGPECGHRLAERGRAAVRQICLRWFSANQVQRPQGMVQMGGLAGCLASSLFRGAPPDCPNPGGVSCLFW